MKKKVLLGFIIFLLVAGGVLFYLLKYTNLLLTKKQIFWKYAIKNGEIIELFNSDDMKTFRQKKSNSSYKQNSKLKISKDSDSYELSTETNAKDSNNVYTYAVLEKNAEKVIDAKVVKKSNFISLKVDELADFYITVKNNNLKELAKKMGLGDVELIPDSINSCNYLELLEISKEDSSYISKKYSKLLMSKTKGSNYEKVGKTTIEIDGKSYDVDAYRFTLTENEMKDLSTTVCKTLSEDSRTLNLISTKLKLLNVPPKYTSINYLSEKCSEMADNINSTETTDDEFIQITVYIQGQDLVQTDVKFRDENLIKIIYNKNKKTLSIKQELLNKSNKFILSISDVLDYAVSKVKEVNISTEVQDNKVITRANIACEQNLNISYEAETEITDNVKIDNEFETAQNVVLNDLSEDQLKYLTQLLVKQVEEIYNYKTNKAVENTNQPTGEEVDNSEQNTEEASSEETIENQDEQNQEQPEDY